MKKTFRIDNMTQLYKLVALQRRIDEFKHAVRQLRKLKEDDMTPVIIPNLPENQLMMWLEEAKRITTLDEKDGEKAEDLH